MGLVAAARDLMPAGKPDFSKIKSYPSISQLIPTVGAPTLHKLLMVLIKNYCNSVNVPEGKNMNEDQIIEAAGFLLDECDNYRIEDYVMMFTLAKRGKLESGKTGRIFDRVDIQLISDFKANYEQIRRQGEDSIMQDELLKLETTRIPDDRDNANEPDEVKAKRFDAVMEKFKEMQKNWKKEQNEEFMKQEQERNKRFDDMLKKMAEENPDYAGPIIVKRNENKNP